MVNYDEFLQDVLIDCPNCPEPYAIYYIRKAAIEFCERTHIWRETLTSESVIPNQSEYTIITDDNRSVVSIKEAFNNKKHLNVTSIDELDKGSEWREKTNEFIDFIYLINRSKFRLVPIPNELSSGTIKLDVIIKPSQNSYEVPQFFFEDHLEVIAAGAKRKLLKQKTKTWFDPELAREFTNVWNNGIGIAKSQARKSYGTQTLYVPLIKI